MNQAKASRLLANRFSALGLALSGVLSMLLLSACASQPHSISNEVNTEHSAYGINHRQYEYLDVAKPYLKLRSQAPAALLRAGGGILYPLPPPVEGEVISATEALKKGSDIDRVGPVFVPDGGASQARFSHYRTRQQKLLGSDGLGRPMMQLSLPKARTFDLWKRFASFKGYEGVSPSIVGYRKRWSYLTLAKGQKQLLLELDHYLDQVLRGRKPTPLPKLDKTLPHVLPVPVPKPDPAAILDREEASH